MSKCKQIPITTLLKQQQAEIKSIIHLIEENLEPIKIDCQAQIGRLEHENDVRWDCYDVRNWQAMLRNLNNAEKLLKKLKAIKL